MALPNSGFSLADVKAEIVNNGGTVSEPFTLSQAIAIAGKSGEWNKLSDFAGWSYKYLNVSPDTLTYSTTHSSQDVTISSNADWTVSKSQDWITVSATSGSGDATLTITCSDNTGNDKRGGTVTIETTNTDPVISRIISICQDGNTETC